MKGRCPRAAAFFVSTPSVTTCCDAGRGFGISLALSRATPPVPAWRLRDRRLEAKVSAVSVSLSPWVIGCCERSIAHNPLGLRAVRESNSDRNGRGGVAYPARLRSPGTRSSAAFRLPKHEGSPKSSPRARYGGDAAVTMIAELRLERFPANPSGESQTEQMMRYPWSYFFS